MVQQYAAGSKLPKLKVAATMLVCEASVLRLQAGGRYLPKLYKDHEPKEDEHHDDKHHKLVAGKGGKRFFAFSPVAHRLATGAVTQGCSEKGFGPPCFQGR